MHQHIPAQSRSASGSSFWRDAALPFIESRSVEDGRRVCYARHSHETFSIGLIDRGASAYINGDHQCRIEAGTLVLMNPGDVHACNPIQNQPWAYRMLYVETRWLSELQDGLGMDGMDFRRFAPIMTRDPLLQAGLLQKETGSVSFFSQLHERLGLDVEVPVSDLKLQRAAEYIADNYQRSLKLDEISLIAGVSPSSLIRAFKKHFGMTPHAYLTNRRVQFARAELRRGRPISDVALAAGFADQAHLQRAFKQLLAATPGHYRTGGQNVHHNIRQVSSK